MKRSNITRKDLARVINEKMGFSQRSAEEIIDTFFSVMKSTLINGESIKLVHFGTLSVRKKSPRSRRFESFTAHQEKQGVTDEDQQLEQWIEQPVRMLKRKPDQEPPARKTYLISFTSRSAR